MKTSRLIYLITLILLVSFCIYQSTKKEDVYIAFEDLSGYKYQFIDSLDVLKTQKVLIKQTGKFYYQWWEINIDAQKIKKSDSNNIRKLILNSQFLIIKNCQGPGNNENIMDKYKIHIIRWDNEIPYILPVKSVNIVME